MQIDILTLFPDSLSSYLNSSIIKRAQEANFVSINNIDIRAFSNNKNHKVDDTPYGGGAGMLIRVDPVVRALNSVKKPNTHVIILDPKGSVFNQEKAQSLMAYDHLVLIAGHYEGIDARIENYVDEAISLGDFILTGGELGALVITDALVRLTGSITKESHEDDSFSNGLLEYPHYTRPQVFEGLKVPEVLLSGHHEKIRFWRLKQSLKITKEKRPDLIFKRKLNSEERKILDDLKEVS